MSDTSDQSAGRYLLFRGCDYYANGGWIDFKGAFVTVDAAKAAYDKAVADHEYATDWFHVVDTQTMKVVLTKDGEYCGYTGDIED